MEEFLNKLYSYENFGIYLIISIVVLIILFFVILFFGKKDKKEREIEATKKLQQINADAFKDDSIVETVEVNNNLTENIQVDSVNNNDLEEQISDVTPVIEEVPTIMNNTEESEEYEIPEPVLPTVEQPQIEVTEPTINLNLEIPEVPVVEPVKEINNELSSIEQKEEFNISTIEEISPILEKIEEKQLVFNDTNIEDVPVVPVIEQIEEKVVEPIVSDEVEVPTFNFDEIVKSVEETKKPENTYTRGPQIFSSVYVPEKEDVKVEEEPKIEIPEIKEIPKTNDEMDFELPTLKKDVKVEEETEIKEEKIEMPVLNDYDLDNLSGETYDIK